MLLIKPWVFLCAHLVTPGRAAVTLLVPFPKEQHKQLHKMEPAALGLPVSLKKEKDNVPAVLIQQSSNAGRMRAWQWRPSPTAAVPHCLPPTMCLH